MYRNVSGFSRAFLSGNQRKSFLEKMWHSCQIWFYSWHSSAARVQPLAHQKPAWLHLSWLWETLLPFLLRRESNMNGFSLWRARRGNGCLWKEFGGEALFRVDFFFFRGGGSAERWESMERWRWPSKGREGEMRESGDKVEWGLK